MISSINAMSSSNLRISPLTPIKIALCKSLTLTRKVKPASLQPPFLPKWILQLLHYEIKVVPENNRNNQNKLNQLHIWKNVSFPGIIVLLFLYEVIKLVTLKYVLSYGVCTAWYRGVYGGKTCSVGCRYGGKTCSVGCRYGGKICSVGVCGGKTCSVGCMVVSV